VTKKAAENTFQYTSTHNRPST